VTEAAHGVIVHEADRLHERVADGRPDEAEPAGLERAAHLLGCLGLGRDLANARPLVLYRPSADESPEEVDEIAVLRRQGDGRAGIADGRLDLGAVAHDPGIRKQARHIAIVKAGDDPGIEPRERRPIPLALAQDRGPRQPRLRAFENEHLEEVAFVARRHAPLLVVIREVERIAPRSPVAAPPSVRSDRLVSVHRG
jgi:hypothetical protein